MSDLISRQDAVDEIQMLMEQSEDDEHDKTWNNAIRGAVNAVKHHTKSAQPEIIRCKDCKWFAEFTHNGEPTGHGSCNNPQNGWWRCPQADWFCADGERR